MKLGFPVLCIDRFSQIKPAIDAIKSWNPGEPFPEGIGAKIPELEMAQLPAEHKDMDDFGDTLEIEDPAVLAGFYNLDAAVDATMDAAVDDEDDAGTEPGAQGGKHHGE